MYDDIYLESNKTILEIQIPNSTLVQINDQNLHNRFTDMKHFPF